MKLINLYKRLFSLSGKKLNNHYGGTKKNKAGKPNKKRSAK